MIIIKKNMIINQLNISLFFIYFLIQLFIAPKNDYTIISTINTLLTASISNYLLITDYNTFINIYNYKSNEVNELYIYPSKFIVSYVLFDIYYSLNPFKKDFLLHGALILFSLILVEYCEIQHYTCQALLLQTSTLFLTFSKKSDVCGLLFVITFFIYRIIIFPLLTFKYMNNNFQMITSTNLNQNHFITLLVLTLNILNFYWFKKIIFIFKSKLINKIKR